MYKLKKVVGSNDFSAEFIKIVFHYSILQWDACLVVSLVAVGNFAFLCVCTLVGRTSGSVTFHT